MIEINLLGVKTKTKKSLPSVDFSFSPNMGQIFILIFLIILLVEAASLALYTFKLNNQVDMLTQKRNKLKRVEKQVKILKKKIKLINVKISTVKKLKQNRGRAYKLLKEIADVLPSNGIWLTKLEKKGNSIILEGKSFSTEAVAGYMTNLEGLADILKVRFRGRGLVRLSKTKDLYRFYITVTLKG